MPGINFGYLLYLVYDAVITWIKILQDPSVYLFASSTLTKIWWFCFIISWPLLIAIILFSRGIKKIRREETERVYGRPANLIEEVKEDLAVATPERNERWDKILALLSSDNPNDWKQAIMEADKMLEVVVNTFRVPGDNLGEKMKNIEKSDFLTLNEAWQAHKVRNQIAHEQNFHLSQREARQTIDNFEKVFKEFDFI